MLLPLNFISAYYYFPFSIIAAFFLFSLDLFAFIICFFISTFFSSSFSPFSFFYFVIFFFTNNAQAVFASWIPEIAELVGQPNKYAGNYHTNNFKKYVAHFVSFYLFLTKLSIIIKIKIKNEKFRS